MKTYSGAFAGSQIRPLIDNATESVWIVSPWLGKEYAQLLVALSRKGIDVRIITSKVDSNLESLTLLKACENQNLTLLVLDKEKPNDKGVFIHAKIYVADQKFAISGSANLTFSGLNKNIETLSIAETPEEVQQVETAFMRLWLKYEKSGLPKEALSSGTSYLIIKSLPLATGNTFLGSKNVQDVKLTYYPYFVFEFVFRGSVRAPPLFFEDKGFVVLDCITREILVDGLLLNEAISYPVSEYILNTENKYKLEIVQPQTEYRAAKELVLDYIIRKNTKKYQQFYGSRSYDRLFVPRKSDISFLKSYLASVPILTFDSDNGGGLRHSSSVLGSSGRLFLDLIYCPICQRKVTPNSMLHCEACGTLLCRNCIKESGLIFQKMLCPSCYSNKH